MQIWQGEDAIAVAQKALVRRVKCNIAARYCEYTPAMERQ